MISCIYWYLKIPISTVLLMSIGSLLLCVCYLQYGSHGYPGSDVYSASQDGRQENVFAIVRKDKEDVLPPETNEQLTVECQQITYGGNILAGLNDVTALDYTATGQFVRTNITRKCDKEIVPSDLELNLREYRRGIKCVKIFQEEHKIAQNGFWSGNTDLIRHNHHSYLTENSIVIDVGGNVGEDTSAIIRIYKPSAYVILEPIRPLHDRLIRKFNGTKNVFVYNFGLGKDKAYFHVNIEGRVGGATSQFTGSGSGDCLVKVVNATQFMLTLGVGCFEVDLLTVNCEGCEYDVLESLISSSLIQYFRHVQFATHPNLDNLYNPIARYCEIIQILSRTHRPSYRYGFTWESWTRLDLMS